MTDTSNSESESIINFNAISLENFGTHLLFGEINEDSVAAAAEFILKGNQVFDGIDNLSLFINTPGGSVPDGFALIDLMSMSKIPIKTVGLGSIMSMGLLIFVAGSKGERVLTRNAIVMSHQFSGGSVGKFHEMMADVKINMLMERLFIEHMKRHTSMSEKKIKELLLAPSDCYLTASECLKYGICDYVVDALPDIEIIMPSIKSSEPPKEKKRLGRSKKL